MSRDTPTPPLGVSHHRATGASETDRSISTAGTSESTAGELSERNSRGSSPTEMHLAAEREDYTCIAQQAMEAARIAAAAAGQARAAAEAARAAVEAAEAGGGVASMQDLAKTQQAAAAASAAAQAAGAAARAAQACHATHSASTLAASTAVARPPNPGQMRRVTSSNSSSMNGTAGDGVATSSASAHASPPAERPASPGDVPFDLGALFHSVFGERVEESDRQRSARVSPRRARRSVCPMPAQPPGSSNSCSCRAVGSAGFSAWSAHRSWTRR